MKTFLSKLLKLKRNITLADVVLGLIAVSILLYLLVFFVKKDTWTTIEVKVRSYPNSSGGQLDGAPNFWLSKNIKRGDAQLDGLGKKIAIIDKVNRWGDLTNETWITVKINARKDKSNLIRFNYQDISIGNPIKLQFGTYAIEGIVTYTEGVMDDRVKEQKIIKTRVIDWSNKTTETLGIFPWIANAIHKGDRMITLSGDVVAEILTVEIQDADRAVVMANGQIIIQKDPSRKDVYLTIKIATTKVEQTNFFLEDYPIKVDADIPLFFPTYKIIPRIIEIL